MGNSGKVGGYGINRDMGRRIARCIVGKVKVQIELFFRSSISKRQEVEGNIKNIVIQTGGEILSCSVIPEIEYHAILATIPREYAQKL